MDPILFPIIAVHLSFFAGALFYSMSGDPEGDNPTPELARLRRIAGEIVSKFLAFYGLAALVGLLWSPLQSPWLPGLFPLVLGLGLGVAKFQADGDS